MGFLEFFGVWFFLGFWFFLEVFGNVYKIFRVIYPSGILISWDEFFHQKDALFDTWLRFLECSLMKDGTYSGVFSLKIITFGAWGQTFHELWQVTACTKNYRNK